MPPLSLTVLLQLNIVGKKASIERATGCIGKCRHKGLTEVLYFLEII